MPRFCANCGHALSEREVGGKVRPACAECGAVVFEDPKLAVAVLIGREGGVLMGRRSPNSASPGKWSFPAGFVDRGERVEDAAIREVREETGLEIEPVEFLGVWMQPYAGRNVLCLTWLARAVGGVERPGDDLEELRWFGPDELPEPDELAFESFVEILSVWRARQEHA